MEDKSPTEDVYRDVLQKVKDNNSFLTEINLNNLVDSKPEWIAELVDALLHNTTVSTVQLVNTNINNDGGKKLGELLKQNQVQAI
jgi:hypothetical protein